MIGCVKIKADSDRNGQITIRSEVRMHQVRWNRDTFEWPLWSARVRGQVGMVKIQDMKGLVKRGASTFAGFWFVDEVELYRGFEAFESHALIQCWCKSVKRNIFLLEKCLD